MKQFVKKKVRIPFLASPLVHSLPFTPFHFFAFSSHPLLLFFMETSRCQSDNNNHKKATNDDNHIATPRGWRRWWKERERERNRTEGGMTAERRNVLTVTFWGSSGRMVRRELGVWNGNYTKIWRLSVGPFWIWEPALEHFSNVW